MYNELNRFVPKSCCIHRQLSLKGDHTPAEKHHTALSLSWDNSQVLHTRCITFSFKAAVENSESNHQTYFKNEQSGIDEFGEKKQIVKRTVHIILAFYM